MRNSCLSVFIMLIGLLLVAPGCGNEAGELSAEEKYAVDTIYNRKLIGWRAEFDSLCSSQRDTLLLQAIDSLKKERLEEIRLLLNEPDVAE